MKPQVSEVLNRARRRLAAASFQPSTREANLLLAHTLGWTEAQVLARHDHTLDDDDRSRFDLALGRRLTGEPIAYILGRREFYGRQFNVDARVLIPRPETEHLVESALELPLPRSPTVLDIGTGSGCLACTIALEQPTSLVIATDVSPAALAVAQSNLTRHGLSERLYLVGTDLARGLALENVDLVLSNPPYIGYDEASDLSPEIVDFEPELALFAYGSGAAFHRRLLTELSAVSSGSWLVIEIGAAQEQLVRESSVDSPFQLVEIRPDYAGLPRVALLQRH